MCHRPKLPTKRPLSPGVPDTSIIAPSNVIRRDSVDYSEAIGLKAMKHLKPQPPPSRMIREGEDTIDMERRLARAAKIKQGEERSNIWLWVGMIISFVATVVALFIVLKTET